MRIIKQLCIGILTFLSASVAIAAVPGQAQNVTIAADEPSNFVLIHTDVPFLVPLAAKDNDGSFVVSWDAVSGATYYEYRICQQGTCGDWIQSSSASATIGIEISGDYTIDVRACNTDGCGTVSGSEEVGVIGTVTAAQPEAAPAIHVEPLPAPDDASDSVGAIAGQFRVDESGQANYSIPIFTPTGRAGVAPSVSLSYSSQGGRGILGKGWSLSAGSAISRCRQTEELDNHDMGVTLSYDDRFCLDGQRLILASGEYGKNGSIYRTEMASQTRVTAVGTQGSGPQYFKVERKDGSVSYYGETEDSRLESNKVISVEPLVTELSDTVISWAKNRTIDNAGLLPSSNIITYHYDKNSVYGSQYLSKISYPPNNEINFTYLNHPYPQTNMGIGGVSKLIKYLSEVRVKHRGAELRKYEFNFLKENQTIVSPSSDYHYDSDITDLSEVNLYPFANTISTIAYPLRLTSVTESAKNTTGWVAKKPTVFTWQGSTKGYIAGAEVELFNNDFGRIFEGNYQFVDINGDSKADLIYAAKWNGNDIIFKTQLSDGTKFNQAGFVSIGVQPDNEFNWNFIDYNADGFADLFVTDFNAGSGKYQFRIFYGNAEGRYENSSSIILPFTTEKIYTAKPLDYTGDGLQDVIYQDNGWKIRVMERTGNSASPYKFSEAFSLGFDLPTMRDLGFTYPTSESTTYSFDKDMQTADLNFDGKADPLVIAYKESRMDNQSQSYTKSFATIVTQNEAGVYILKEYAPASANLDNPYFKRTNQYVDINGDNLVDHVYRASSNSYWYYQLNSGKEFLPAKRIDLLGTNKYPSYIDYDKDGRLDIAHRKNGKLHIIAGSEFGFTGNQQATNIPVGENYSHSFADINGDGMPEYIEVDMVGIHSITVNKTKNEFINENVVRKIDNGMGNTTVITYKALTDPLSENLYTKGEGASVLHWGASESCGATNQAAINSCSPVFDYEGAIYVVSDVQSSAPTKAIPDAMVSIGYRYGEARMQANGRGFLGFEWLETTDQQTNVITLSEYRQDYPYIGSPLKTTTKFNNLMLSEAVNSWSKKTISLASNNKIHLPYIENTSEKSWDLVGKPTSHVVTASDYDNYGNVLQIKVTNKNPITGLIVGSQTTDNTYQDDIPKWHLGRLKTSAVTHARAGEIDIARASEFEYDNDTGFLIKEIIQPGDEELRLTTVYAYDSYGNKTLKRTCSSIITNTGNCINSASIDDTNPEHINRWSTTVYDNDGLYPVRTLNAFGQTTSEVVERNNLGQPIKVKALNGVITESMNGAFGTPYFTRSNTGSWKKTTMHECSGINDCPVPAVYFSKNESAGGSRGYVYFDALGREVQKAAISFNGQFSVTSVEYNLLGLAINATEPLLQDNPHIVPTNHATTSVYDVLRRPTIITNPDGGVSTIVYDGLTTTTSNPRGHTKVEVKDASGLLVQVTDALSSVLTYNYDATGNLSELKFNGSIQTEIVYDKLGRKIAMKDMDKGGANNKWWTYKYNALGELIEQTDAKGQKIQNLFDRTGRTIKRLNITASNQIESEQKWVYDNAIGFGNSKGQLVKEQDVTSGYMVEPDYDQFGRVIHVDTTIEQQKFLASTIYDQYGRVFQSFDAASSEFANAGVRNLYNQYGFLSQVRDARNGGNGKVYKTIISMDERGNVTQSLNGNGVTTLRSYFAATGRLKNIISAKGSAVVQDLSYVWDFNGNLEERRDLDSASGATLTETFVYDALDRLESANHPNEVMNLTYYANGNIQTKSDVGTYTYGETCDNGVTAGTHAVTSTSIGNKSYCYDFNGNMVSDNDRQMVYSTFDKLTEVTKGDHKTQFSYAPSRSRYKRVDTKAGKVTTTYYVGNVEVIKVLDSTVTNYRRNLGGLIIDEKSNGTKTTSYLHTDHIGSTDVITNNNGQIKQEFSFNAFGARRGSVDWKTYNQNAWAIALSPADQNARTSRGFTGHEQMDEVGLIHMNGRVYDSLLGRFIQADPHIQAPSDSQSLNRYSYVKNNPLSYTDPTGYFFKKLWSKIRPFVGAIVGALMTYFCGPYCGQIGYAIITGAIAGAAGAAATGGNILQGAVIGAFSAAAFFEVGTTFGPDPTTTAVVAHGTVGGIFSVVQGGKFGHGFASAGFAKLSSGEIRKIDNFGGRVTMAAIVGGTGSRISGGKFVNGAITGAFSRLFNDESHDETDQDSEKKGNPYKDDRAGWEKRREEWIWSGISVGQAASAMCIGSSGISGCGGGDQATYGAYVIYDVANDSFELGSTNLSWSNRFSGVPTPRASIFSGSSVQDTLPHPRAGVLGAVFGRKVVVALAVYQEIGVGRSISYYDKMYQNNANIVGANPFVISVGYYNCCRYSIERRSNSYGLNQIKTYESQ